MKDIKYDNEFGQKMNLSGLKLKPRGLLEVLKNQLREAMKNFNYILAAIFFMLALASVISNGMIANDNANFWLLFTLISMGLNNITKGIQ